MEIQGTPAPRARVLKVLRFDGAFGAEGYNWHLYRKLILLFFTFSMV